MANQEIDKAEAYRRGNTKLLRTLMDLVGQVVPTTGLGVNDPIADRLGMTTAERNALAILVEAGMAEEVAGGWQLLYEKLEEREKL